MNEQQNTLDLSIKILIRGANHLIDILISTTAYLLITTMFFALVLNNNDTNDAVKFIYSIILYTVFKFMYYFVSELLFAKTPGKFITQTQVISEQRSKPSTGAIALRTLCRVIPFNEFSPLVLKGRTFHDTISHTDVQFSKLVPVNLRLGKTPNLIFTIISSILIVPVIVFIIWTVGTYLISGEDISLPKTMPKDLRITNIETKRYKDTHYTEFKYSGDNRELIITWIIAGFNYDPDNPCNYMRPTSLEGYGYEELDSTLVCRPLFVNSQSSSGQWSSLYKIESQANSTKTSAYDIPDYYLSDPPHRLNIKISKGSFSEAEITKMYNDGLYKTNYKTIKKSSENP